MIRDWSFTPTCARLPVAYWYNGLVDWGSVFGLVCWLIGSYFWTQVVRVISSCILEIWCLYIHLGQAHGVVYIFYIFFDKKKRSFSWSFPLLRGVHTCAISHTCDSTIKDSACVNSLPWLVSKWRPFLCSFSVVCLKKLCYSHEVRSIFYWHASPF